MKVDGTTQQTAAVSTQQNAARRETQPTTESASGLARDAARISTTLRDSFEHVEEGTRVETYGEAVVGAKPDGVVSGAFASLRASLETPQSADIVDLETAVNATGLPLLPERSDTGALQQDVLKTYDVGGARTDAGAPVSTPADLLDTLG